MAVVKELIRTEENGAISFGDYELAQKSKLSDYQHQGDMYKVKTFKEITKLERNGMFVYESVPGTAVFNLTQSEAQMDFHVEGPEDAQITSPEHTAYQAGDYRYMFQYLKLFAKKPLPVRQGHFVTD